MKSLLLVVLLGLVASLAYATEGSISDHLFDDDVNDDDEVFVADEHESLDITTERKRNPCFSMKCKRGETCVLTEDKKAGKCVCTPDCSFYQRNNPRYMVCSNNNDTYETSCHLDQDHCRCTNSEEGCTKKDSKKITLEYYGGCQDFPVCTEEEAEQFPIRTKEWLFVVMQELDRRSKLDEYKDLLETAREDSNHSMAVIWKFCDLDKDPQDRSVSRRELQYMVRSLKALEHCLVPFLDNCDTNNDRNIDLVEWGDCLGMDHEQISDKCLKISQNSKKNKNKK